MIVFQSEPAALMWTLKILRAVQATVLGTTILNSINFLFAKLYVPLID